MQDRITHWTFRDIFLSLTLALDPVLLAVAYVGLMTAGAAYGFFFFLGAATSDQGAQGTASVFGGILFVGIWILAAGILARLVATKLLEGRNATAREIWRYLALALLALLLGEIFATRAIAAHRQVHRAEGVDFGADQSSIERFRTHAAQQESSKQEIA